MFPNDGPKEPSRPTVKALFALSGNRCAFPDCMTPLVDPQSQSLSVVGEVCHIKGEKKDAARFDSSQTNEQRHGFDNLILLCNVHHKIVDDDAATYTVERLLQMKSQNEARPTIPPIDPKISDRFLSFTISDVDVHGPAIISQGQSGGQTAHTINNYGQTPADDAIKLEGKLTFSCELELLRTVGCPGLVLTVICRSIRPAKIQSAQLLIEGTGFMERFKQGFNSSFGYTPIQGHLETMFVKLHPLSPSNSQSGFILNRDDAARFFYPIALPSTKLALESKPENVCVAVKFFDDTEQALISGAKVQQDLRSLFETYPSVSNHVKISLPIGVRVRSTTAPRIDVVGQVNKRPVQF